MKRDELNHVVIFQRMLAEDPRAQANPLQKMLDYVFSVYPPNQGEESARKANQLRGQLQPIIEKYPGYLDKHLS